MQLVGFQIVRFVISMYFAKWCDTQGDLGAMRCSIDGAVQLDFIVQLHLHHTITTTLHCSSTHCSRLTASHGTAQLLPHHSFPISQHNTATSPFLTVPYLLYRFTPYCSVSCLMYYFTLCLTNRLHRNGFAP